MKINEIEKFVEYDPTSPTLLRWKTRSNKNQESARFNKRFANKPAGTTANASRWHYAAIGINKKKLKVHRVIYILMVGQLGDQEMLDHIDRNIENNHPSNLRKATYSQNLSNTKSRARELPRGVKKVGNKYRATLYHEKKAIHLGYFTSICEAEQNYLAALKKAKGEFAHNHGRG